MKVLHYLRLVNSCAVADLLAEMFHAAAAHDVVHWPKKVDDVHRVSSGFVLAGNALVLSRGPMDARAQHEAAKRFALSQGRGSPCCKN